MNTPMWYRGFLFLSAIVVVPISFANSGTMEGILSAKGDTWMDVLDDGDFLHRFIPKWIGDGPANGGFFDQGMIQQINELVVGNRVRVKWVHDGHLRVLDADTLPPKYDEGIFVGYLLKTSKRWIDVQHDKQGKPWRFYLPWVGGYPSQGGGYDQKVLKELQNRKPTDPVRFSWQYKARPTIVSVYEKINDSITPFWVGKKLPEPKQIRSIVTPKKAGNPDNENGKPSSPFDMLPSKPSSPFDQINPQANPFNQLGVGVSSPNPSGNAQPANTGKGESKVNPFENLPLPQ